MSHLFATALLLTLSATSAGLLKVSQAPSAQPLESEAGQVALAAGQPDAWANLPQRLTQAADLEAQICLSLPQWQRPSEVAQAKQLEALGRYDTALPDDPLADIAKAWWSHEAFSFTTYGLSARTDPLYLSGVWTALDDTWGCYDGEQPERLNLGELAELWLLHHQLVSLEWQDNQYLATVEPGATGLQLVQFPRRESDPVLPLTIVTTAGQALAVMSGDW